jgi:hypothetical protein
MYLRLPSVFVVRAGAGQCVYSVSSSLVDTFVSRLLHVHRGLVLSTVLSSLAYSVLVTHLACVYC